LTGTRSVVELAKFIKQSMPPTGPKCPAPDADKIAPYIYDAFYSPLAQERIRPARITLQRLTVRQFRNAVSDLVSPPHSTVPSDPPTGLYGEYFKGRDTDEKNRLIKRIDPEVNFDFKDRAPTRDQFDPHFFSIAWQGDVLAPDTGEYEFVVRSDQAVQLWVNGWKKPLIDEAVRSANDNEFRASIYLLGGRAYPIRLTFSKVSQGVDDRAKKKAKPPAKAFVSLLWTRPLHATETIPSFCLYTQTDYPTFVVKTPFPPDDRSTGYERGNSVSKDWDDATTAAALETADYVSANLAEVTGIKEDATDRREKLLAYCRQFVQRAFRRPLSKDVVQTYIAKQFAVAPNLETAVKRVVILTLKSPRFLYREIGSGNGSDAYTVASQLSFGLWNTLPDEEIERAASSGELTTRSLVARQAERMVNDPRAWTKLREFLIHWLKVDEVPDIVKNPKHFPDFDVASVSDLRTSLELFLQNTAWNDKSDYRDLMLSKTEYLNGRLAKMYGADLPIDAPFQPVIIDPKERSGLVTNPYLLTRFAYLDTSSPIHRGVLIVRSFLGRVLNPPPAAFAPLAPSLHPDLTTRERVALQTHPAMCTTCHGIINPLGFTLERFDAIGRLRDQENGKPVDCSGSYRSGSGTLVHFSGATELAQYLADSDESHAAFVEKLFQHLVKQPALAYGPNTIRNLKAFFSENRYSIRRLMSEIVMATVPNEVPQRTSKSGVK